MSPMAPGRGRSRRWRRGRDDRGRRGEGRRGQGTDGGRAGAARPRVRASPGAAAPLGARTTPTVLPERPRWARPPERIRGPRTPTLHSWAPGGREDGCSGYKTIW